MNILVSSCLLGINCRYDGKGFDIKRIRALLDKYNVIPVCAEQFGGLTTPRTPVEVVNGKAIAKDGKDCTIEFTRGAEEVLKIAKLYNVKYAVLKSRSPSCGFGKIYDGTFSGKLTDGEGITAKLLNSAGIKILNEENFDKVL